MNATQIKNALKAAGLDEGLYETLKLGERRFGNETELNSEIEKIKTEQDIYTKLDKAGLDKTAIENLIEKRAQSQFDQKITKALQTSQDNSEKKMNELKQQLDELQKGQQNGKTDDEPSHQDALTEDQKTISSLKTEIQELSKKIDDQSQAVQTLSSDKKTETLNAQKKEALVTVFKGHQVDESHIESLIPLIPDSDEPESIAQSAETLKSTYLDMHQADINQKIESGEIPKAGTSVNLSNAAIEAAADSLNKGESSHGLASKPLGIRG